MTFYEKIKKKMTDYCYCHILCLQLCIVSEIQNLEREKAFIFSSYFDNFL
jgi:hypothetical protein